MKIQTLIPPIKEKTQFALSHLKTVPEKSGCYVLATYHDDILYVGLASVSIKERMKSHLESKEKRAGGPMGVPFWFYYLEVDSKEVGQIESGWINQSILEDGKLPPLNKIHGPG